MPYPLPPKMSIHVELKSFPPRHEMKAMEVYSDFYGLSLITQGERKLITPHMISLLTVGDVGFTDKQMYHRATYMTSLPYERYLIKFTDKMIDYLLDSLGISSISTFLTQPVYRFSLEIQTKLKRLFQSMLYEFQHYGKYSEMILERCLQELILIIKREYLPYSSDDLIICNANNKVIDAVQYIDTHYQKTPSLEQVAASVHFSSSHFSRLFKETMKMTYSSYLASVKLQHARIQLIHTTQTIDEIAVSCGFSSGNYLCSQFKKCHGITPTNYRRQYRCS
ncbi:MAG: helix-turn-helix domain-containing protein [Lachnospiraceae bacterium]